MNALSEGAQIVPTGLHGRAPGALCGKVAPLPSLCSLGKRAQATVPLRRSTPSAALSRRLEARKPRCARWLIVTRANSFPRSEDFCPCWSQCAERTRNALSCKEEFSSGYIGFSKISFTDFSKSGVNMHVQSTAPRKPPWGH